MQNIDIIEQKITEKSRSNEKKWQDIAKLIIDVEKNDLWRTKPNTRSFTVWLKNLATESKISESSLWMSYRAGKKMLEIWNRKNPSNADSFDEIVENMGDLSASALDTLETIKSTKVDSSFYDAIEEEYLSKSINVTSLGKIARELGRSRREGLEPIELFSTLHRINFRELISLKNGPQKVLTDLPKNFPVNAIVIIPEIDESEPIFIGLKSDNFDVDVPDSFDYVITISTKEDMHEKINYSHIKINCINGQIDIVKDMKMLSPSSEKKGKIALALLNKMMTSEKSPM